MRLNFGKNVLLTEEEFRTAITLVYDPLDAPDLIEHELAHFKKARELGYKAHFELGINQELHLDDVCVKIDHELPLAEHRILIALAPVNPSRGDYKIVEEAKQS